MGLDIRLPLGLAFALIGGLLTVFGAVTRGSALYAPAMGLDINLIWGAAMLLFGVVMIVAARRAR